METLAIFKEDDDYSELSKRWQLFSARANDLQLQSDGLNEELKDICFQWELFESRYFELLPWLHKLRINFITPLKESDEGSVDFVLGKLFKVREIEKKLAEKVFSCRIRHYVQCFIDVFSFKIYACNIIT